MPSSVFEVTDDTLSQEPVKLVRFSHGRLKEGKLDALSWTCYQRKRGSLTAKGQDRRILAASVKNGLTYTGQNFGPHAVDPHDTCNYYLAVRSKSTSKVKVLPAELYKMEPQFEDEAAMESTSTDVTESFRERNSALTKDFGSGKRQRAVLKQEANQLDQAMVSATTQVVAKSAHTEEQIEGTSSIADMQEVSALPPHNKDATTPGDVYKLKDIIKDEVMASLAEQCKVFVDSTAEDIQRWRTEKTYSAFILRKLETLSVREDARLFQSQCLMYLHCLIKTFLLKYTDMRKKNPLPEDWAEPVKKSILETFTVETKNPHGKRRSMPPQRKDLLLSHILVLCLKLNGYVLALNPLMPVLNISVKKLTTHASVIGCTVKCVRDPKDKSVPAVYSAELKVPVKFPEIRGKSNRPKKIF